MKKGRRRMSEGLVAVMAARLAAVAIEAKFVAAGDTVDCLVFVWDEDPTKCAGVLNGKVAPVDILDSRRRESFATGASAEAWLDRVEEIPFEHYDLMWFSEALRGAVTSYVNKLHAGLKDGVAPDAGQARQKRKST